MKKFTTEEGPREIRTGSFDIDGKVLMFEVPKVARVMQALRETQAGRSAKADYEFLSDVLDTPSWEYLEGRLADPTDKLDQDMLAAIVRHIVEETFAGGEGAASAVPTLASVASSRGPSTNGTGSTVQPPAPGSIPSISPHDGL